jgi:hypothetical protein
MIVVTETKKTKLCIEKSNALKAAFDEREVKTLKQSWGEVQYITARMVMDRLDDVVSPTGWTDSYVVLSDGSVECSLSVTFDGSEWLTRCDVGTADGSEPMKAAYSDALKRAAVKFGVGRYLYGDTPPPQNKNGGHLVKEALKQGAIPVQVCPKCNVELQQSAKTGKWGHVLADGTACVLEEAAQIIEAVH